MFIPSIKLNASTMSALQPKFSGEAAESSKQAGKRPQTDTETVESADQASKKLRMEEHETDTFFREFIREIEESSQQPGQEIGESSRQPERPVQDPNVHMLNPQFYQPLMARHGKEFLNDAVRYYTDIKTPDRKDELAPAYHWISRLLKNGADPNAKPPEVPVINRALNNGKPILAQKMKSAGAHVLPSNITLGIRQHLFKLIKQLEVGGRPQEQAAYRTAIAQMIPFLKAPGMNLTIREWQLPESQGKPSLRSLLHWAANKQHPELTREILEAGVPANIRAEYGTPLEELLATQGANLPSLGNPELVADALIEHGADVNRQNALGDSLLMQAIQKHLIPISEKLAAAGANPNTSNLLTRKAPLHQAIQSGDANMAKTLIQSGADVNARTTTGTTPLIEAIREKYLDVAEVLLDQPNLDINLADNEGRTPLSYAATLKGRNADTLVKKLLEKGANPFLSAKNGKSPLIYAIENNREKNVQALVIHHPAYPPSNVDLHIPYATQLVNQPDENGVKPLVWAMTQATPNTTIMKILQKYTKES